MRPACSSTQAAAIQPGACFGFDLTSESKSILARLMSPISASDLSTTLLRSVRYPLGSIDEEEPEMEEVPEILNSKLRSAFLNDEEWIKAPDQALETGLCHAPVPFRRGWSRPRHLQAFRSRRTNQFKSSSDNARISRNKRTSCCLTSNEFSSPPLSRSPTITLSGTAYVLPRSRILRFLVKLPTSGMLSHCSSVTTERARFRSANCV